MVPVMEGFPIVVRYGGVYHLRSYGVACIARIHPLPMVRVCYSYLLRNSNEKHVRLGYLRLSLVELGTLHIT